MFAAWLVLVGAGACGGDESPPPDSGAEDSAVDGAADTCTYRNPGGPSAVDEGEYQTICAVTVLEPPRPIYCAVYP